MAYVESELTRLERRLPKASSDWNKGHIEGQIKVLEDIKELLEQNGSFFK